MRRRDSATSGKRLKARESKSCERVASMATEAKDLQNPELALSIPEEAYTGLDVPDALDIDDADVSIPRIRLLQPTRMDDSYEAIPDGHFVLTATGEDLGNRLEIVVLATQKSRARFAPVDEGGELLCRSADGITGVGDPGGECDKCPFSKWGPANEPPACSLAHNYFVIGADGAPLMPAILRLQRTAMSEARRWNTMLRAYRPHFSVVYEVTTVKAGKGVTKGVPFYLPKVRPIRRVSRELAEEYALLARQVSEVRARAIEAQQAADAAAFDEDALTGTDDDVRF